MGQFKPMVKMETTEPSVELKLKKGGSVKAPKMMNGGVMGALSAAPAPGSRGGMAPVARPAKPSMASRRKAMMGRPMMAEGGESKAEHKAEMKKMSKVEHELKAHESKPASKAHKGLKTGGVAKSPKPGNYATGGVVMGQGGFKEGGVIKSTKGKTMMHTAKVDTNSAPTGEVKLGNAGGYKKGGAAKKAYATGGAVNDSGRAVAYPKKAASKSVKNNLQTGTFKTGGSVTPAEKKAQANFKTENATAMRQAKAMSNLKYNKGGEIDFDSPAARKAQEKAFGESIGPSKEDLDMAKSIRDIPGRIYRGAKSMLGLGQPSAKERKVIADDTTPKTGSVTETQKSITVTPAKKRGGSVKC